MRASQWLWTTLKETPQDAEIISHQLMLRAGLIKKLGSGLYTWLPLGLKVLRRVEQIVREEMNRIGSLELLMPAVQPAELWHETGRWETFGGQLLTMKDSQERLYCFGPTHEEVITDFVRSSIHSYKTYPFTLYQIQTKFRDELRPRFGLMRAREFLMKDAYSFHLTQTSLQTTYDAMYQAYSTIFDRLGLAYRAVEADTGAIGGSYSHEFQVMAQAGEDLIYYSTESAYAANVEKAAALPPEKAAPATQARAIKVHTPQCKSIESVAAAFKCAPQHCLKTLLVKGSQHPVVALVLRGDDVLNPIKAAKHPLVHDPLILIEESTALNDLQLPIGFVGPLSLSIPVIADHVAASLSEFVCGANEVDYHYQHASWGQEAQYQEVFDLRTVKEGDPSPDGHGTLKACRGIEVGHIFQLGDKYTKIMNVTVLNEAGKSQTPIMGTYGLGISRVVAAAIEQQHDARGICWTEAMAPFTLVIIPIDKTVMETANRLYEEALSKGIDVLLDDRDERPGVKFADCDLIGIPHRLVVGPKHLANNQVEYKARRAETPELLPLEEALKYNCV